MKTLHDPRVDKQGRTHGKAGTSGPESYTTHKDRWGLNNYTRSERMAARGIDVRAKWDMHRRIYCYGERVR